MELLKCNIIIIKEYLFNLNDNIKNKIKCINDIIFLTPFKQLQLHFNDNNNNLITKEETLLYHIALKSEGYSGRKLRKLPLQAQAYCMIDDNTKVFLHNCLISFNIFIFYNLMSLLIHIKILFLYE